MTLTQSGSAAGAVRVVAVALAALATGSCDGGGTAPEPAIAAVTVSPAPATVGMGGVLQFTATAVDENGDAVHATPAWTVVNGGGAIGEGTGTFTAGTVPGTFANTVQATVRGVAGTATVHVTQAALASITITPNPASVALNGSLQFTATGRDAAGNAVAVTPTWSVVAGGGTITPGGNFIAGAAAGTFANTVQAAAGGVTASATVEVTAGALARITIAPDPAAVGMGGEAQFTATGFDANGAEVRVAPEWSVVAGGGTIGAATGIFTAGAVPGGYANTVRATMGPVSATATVNVPATALQVSPPAATVGPGGTLQLTATALDARGSRVAVPAAWSVVAGGGTIDAGGLFTAGTTAGSFAGTVRAEIAGATAFADVTVAPGALAAILLTPDSLALGVNGTARFTAAGRDASGNAVSITPVWSVANGGGTIAPDGLFTAGPAPGTFPRTVRATAGGVQGAATVTVSTGPVATFVITPSSAQVAHHQTRQFTATARDASGNVIAVTPTWSVSAGGGAITPDGLYTAGGTLGSFSVQAAIPGWTASAPVTVTPGPLATITVAPDPATVQAQQSVGFVATGRDAGGYAVPITPTWSVVNGGGTIAPNGLFTAGGTAGAFAGTVQAAAGGVQGSASVTVTPGPIATFAITPASAQVVHHESLQFTATARDAGGNVVPVTPTWSVYGGDGRITANGTFTAGIVLGTLSVQASIPGRTATASVTITPGPLATITVTPNPATVRIMYPVTFVATGRDAGGYPVPITPAWSVVNGGGTINGGGTFAAGTATGSFANTVRATAGGVSGFATVNVAPGELTSIAVTPVPAFVVSGQTLQFTAVGRDAHGNAIPLTPTWSVSSGGGTIDPTGLFTAGAATGTFPFTVRAHQSSISSFPVHVNVTAAPFSHIAVTPDPVMAGCDSYPDFVWAVAVDVNGDSTSVGPVTLDVVNGGGYFEYKSPGQFWPSDPPGTYEDTIEARVGPHTAYGTVIVLDCGEP